MLWHSPRALCIASPGHLGPSSLLKKLEVSYLPVGNLGSDHQSAELRHARAGDDPSLPSTLPHLPEMHRILLALNNTGPHIDALCN